MGKGSRNRQFHQQDMVDNPQRYKEQKRRKPMPKWATTAICIVLLLGILFGIGAYIFTKYGIIERNRVLIESKTGEFDITQPTATYIAWQNTYYQAMMEYEYMRLGYLKDEQGVTKVGGANYVEREQYGLVVAQLYLKDYLRDAIDGSLDTLKELVAVCDDAYLNNIHLDENDQALVDEAIQDLTEQATKYNYYDLTDFLSENMYYGMRVDDVRRATEMSVLYNKYKNQTKSTLFTGLTTPDLNNFRDAHAEDFYKMDYLTYVTDSEDFAKQLTANTVVNADQFKELILNKHFDDNYKTSFNKFVTQVQVADIYDSVKKLSDTDTETKLSDKLDEYGFEAVTEYKAADENDETLEKWLFDSKRKTYDVATFANKAGDGLYVVAFYSAAANTDKVDARVKLYNMVDGDSLGSDTNFKESVREYLKGSKKPTPTFPETIYVDAAEKGKAFKEECEALATNTEKKQLFNDRSATVLNGMTQDTSDEKVPTELRDQLFLLKDLAVDEIVVINDGVYCYVVYVTGMDTVNEKFDILYVTFEADTFYLIVDDLTTSLNKVYPTDKTTNLIKDAAANTFEAWISERGSSATVSARNTFDKKYFTSSKTDTAGATTYSYTVYMVVNKPMYLDESISINGGYLHFYGTNDEGLTAYQQAEQARAKLQDKSYAELISAFNSLATGDMISTPTVSSTITKETINAYVDLQKWFFDTNHEPNSVAIVGTEGKSQISLAIFIDKDVTWKNLAKEGVVDERVTEWIAGLTAGYTVNTDALDSIGAPTPEQTTQTAAVLAPVGKWEI